MILPKITIKNQDANEIKNEVCDCLFLDHFESDPETYIQAMVRKISDNNQFKTLWYWPAGNHFLKFLAKNGLEISQSSYNRWKEYIEIRNLPDKLDDKTFLYFQELKRIYQTDTPQFSNLRKSLENAELRNNLLKLSKNIKA